MYVYMYIICPAYTCRKGKEENAAAFCMKKLFTVTRQTNPWFHRIWPWNSCILLNWKSDLQMVGNFGHAKAVSLPLSAHIELLSLCVKTKSSETCKLLWNIYIGVFVSGIGLNWSCPTFKAAKDNLIDANWVAAKAPGLGASSPYSGLLRTYFRVIIG